MFTVAAAPFRIPNALMMGGGIRSWGWLMRKFSRDRSVWAPQYLSLGTWISPKASLSVLVAAIFVDEAWKYLAVLWSDVGGVRKEEGAAPACAGRQTTADVLEELEMHVLRARVLPLGLAATQLLAEPEAHVLADESILAIKGLLKEQKMSFSCPGTGQVSIGSCLGANEPDFPFFLGPRT